MHVYPIRREGGPPGGSPAVIGMDGRRQTIMNLAESRKADGNDARHPAGANDEGAGGFELRSAAEGPRRQAGSQYSPGLFL